MLSLAGDLSSKVLIPHYILPTPWLVETLALVEEHVSLRNACLTSFFAI